MAEKIPFLHLHTICLLIYVYRLWQIMSTDTSDHLFFGENLKSERASNYGVTMKFNGF